MSISIQVTLGGTVAWGVVSVGAGSAVACDVGVRSELCASVGDSGVVGAPVGLVLVSAELWLVPAEEADETSGGEVETGGGDEAGA